MADGLTLGVEEEFFAVDATTRALVVDAAAVLAAAGGPSGGYPGYAEELRPSMLESRTSPCHTLDQLRGEIGTLRQRLVAAAAETGHRIVAAGSLPLADWHTQTFNPAPRYQRVAEVFAQMASEHVICGCHVHVGIDDRDVAVQVMNRVRPWLPVLLVLSSSSPFWMGEDTGFMSYRSVVWERWPMAGIPPQFASFEAYTQVVGTLVEAEVLADAGQAFWDVRPGIAHKTLEFRIADSCATVDETILQAGLCRALVRTCLDELGDGRPPAPMQPELLRAAKWRAARFGFADRLLDPFSGTLCPATTLVDRLLAHVRGSLEEAGDWDEVSTLVEDVERTGSSAQRQRKTFIATERLTDVVDLMVEETALVRPPRQENRTRGCK